MREERRYCFKTNLLAEDSGRTVRFGKFPGCRLRFLPYWLATEKYSLPVAQHKDIDVFFAGDVNSPERQFSLAALRQLENEGFTIHFAPQRLAFTEYLAVMSRSWLTLSPQGLGYNGFRHYESMLVGSIPLINRPTLAIVHDFAHGRNSFLYSIESRDIQQVARAALRDKPQLSRIVAGLRQFVIENHSIEAVGEICAGPLPILCVSLNAFLRPTAGRCGKATRAGRCGEETKRLPAPTSTETGAIRCKPRELQSFRLIAVPPRLFGTRCAFFPSRPKFAYHRMSTLCRRQIMTRPSRRPVRCKSQPRRRHPAGVSNSRPPAIEKSFAESLADDEPETDRGAVWRR